MLRSVGTCCVLFFINALIGSCLSIGVLGHVY